MSKAMKERVINPFFYRRDTCEYLSGSHSGSLNYSYGRVPFSEYGVSSGLGTTGYGPDHKSPPSASSPVFADEVDRKALSRMQTKVARASVNLAQAFAERKQAVDMISKRAWQLANLALDIRHGRFRDASRRIAQATGLDRPRGALLPNGRKAAREFASNWLEYQYGWRPLLSDIYGSCEAIARTYHERRPAIVTGSASEDHDILFEPGFTWYGSGFTAQQYWNGRITDRCRYTVQFAEDEPLATALASTGVTNPLLLGWELLPYSFVVDWFLPVGNYLQQLEYARGLRFLRGSKTRYRSGKASGISRLTYPGAGQEHSSFVFNVSWNTLQVNRTVLTGWPYQDFPVFQPSLGVTRVLNATALITQVFTGGKVRRHAF